MEQNLQEPYEGSSTEKERTKSSEIREKIAERFVQILSSEKKTKTTRKPKSGKGI